MNKSCDLILSPLFSIHMFKRRLIYILLAFVASFTLTGCKKENNSHFIQKRTVAEFDNYTIIDNKYATVYLTQLEAIPEDDWKYYCEFYLRKIVHRSEDFQGPFALKIQSIAPVGIGGMVSDDVIYEDHEDLGGGSFHGDIPFTKIKDNDIKIQFVIEIYRDVTDTNKENRVFSGEYILHFREEDPIEIIEENIYE